MIETIHDQRVCSDPLAWLALQDYYEEMGEPYKHPTRTFLLPGEVPMVFSLIPPGKFLMGSPENEEGRYENETQHKVEITEGLYMGIYPVTQIQWQAVMGSNPSHFKRETNPVETVSWDDCQAFCEKLSQVTGKPFRLPTEAEWEYACRAGTTTAYHSGNGEEALKKVGWYSGNSGNQTHPVGQKDPNAWGLFDTHGNIWEWCQDWHGSYKEDEQESGPYQLIRGGCWQRRDIICRSAARGGFTPGNRSLYLGLRVALCMEES